MASRIDRENFLRNLQQSGLLSSQEIEEALPQLPESNRGRVLARSFVKMGLLTKFQAELLLAGRTSGFRLGQYGILDQLGQGGMGRVFKAVHQTMNRVVALKLLAPHLVNTPKARKLFQREVQAAAKLVHPNIVTAYDANQIGDRHFLVMEYVPGLNLDQLVREKGPLPVELACEVIRQASLGLQYAHEMGMVHRDIKPANLLVQGNPKNNSITVKILDFGLARLHEHEQESPSSEDGAAPGRTVMGTPDYLSPEQGRGIHDVDIRSDLYSLGCTFYYLLVGRVPFPGGTSLEKLARHQNEEAILVENYRPDVPETVADIVRRLMSKEADKRFQSPAELAAALVPFAAATVSYWNVSPALDSVSSSPALPSTGDLQLEKNPDGNLAMMGTFPPDLGPTPLSNLSFPPADLWEREDQVQFKRTLFWALGLAASLVGLIILLLNVR